MRNFTKPLLILAIFNIVILLFAGSTSPDRSSYIIIGWNSLGMHCSNKDFSKLCVLPPYNEVNAQVIKVGDATHYPQIITKGMKVTYEIPGNTTSITKTNFWTYAKALFGVTLANNIGLAGKGLSGTMDLVTGDHYQAEGVPICPFTDANLTTEAPYQLGLLKLYDSVTNTLLASTQPVIPVSNEINCVSSGCHSSETSILNNHPKVTGFNAAATPILCANCHGSNALSLPGKAGVKSLSQQVHEQHAEVTNDCYKCHPGVVTKCLRDTMFSRGFVCQTCHGSVSNVATTIANGRIPWFQEPQCGASTCHGSNFAEETGKLYRNSKGHGNLYCAVCHGSPHAIQPTIIANDNVQNISLQGFRGKLKKCSVCHGITPNLPGPHGFVPTDIESVSSLVPSVSRLMDIYPNPFVNQAQIPFAVSKNAKVHLDVFNLNGQLAISLVSEQMKPGQYSVTCEARLLKPGTYLVCLTVGQDKYYKRMVVAGK